MKTAVGNPMCCTFYCKHLVAGVLTLFDPTVVKCSWINPLGVEDAQTYGGTDTGDSLLTRISVGTYQAIYTANAAGVWRVSPYWSHTSGGLTIAYKPFVSGRIEVAAVPFAFADTPAP